MENIKRFIEDALQADGEWKEKEHWYFSHFNGDEAVFGDGRYDSENNPCYYVNIHKILLDPLAWQAVGKTRGWVLKINGFRCGNPDCNNKECRLVQDSCESCGEILEPKSEGVILWSGHWHSFIDSLISGLSIDEALDNIEK